MKKRLLAAVLVSGVALAAAVPTALAADISGPAKSDVEVNLDVDGDNGGEGPYIGKLAIARKPILYRFNGTIGTTSITATNEFKKSGVPQYIAVNDDRDQSDKGNWKLDGKLSEFTDASNNKFIGKIKFVPGALLQYDIGTITTPEINFNPPAVDPLAGAGDTTIYDLQPDFTLTSRDVAKVFLQVDGTDVTGVGAKNGIATDLSNAVLTIDQNIPASQAGTYTGEIIWSLSDVI